MQIGSFFPHIQLLAMVISIAAGHLINRYRLRQHAGRRQILDDVLSAAVAGLLLWKVSYFLLYPRESFENPASLLFFDGGEFGNWLGTIGFVSLISWKAWKHRSMSRQYISSGAVVMLTALLMWGVLTTYDSRDIRAGEPAPDFVLNDVDGTPVRLSDYRGKTVLLNFWASWCPPCRAEMPHLQSLHEKTGGKNTAVLTVNLTSTENSEASVLQFVQKGKLSFPVALDTDGNVAAQYRIKVYPTTYVIGQDGTIRERIQGAMTFAAMWNAVTKRD